MPPHPRDFGHSWEMASQECAGRFLGERKWSSNVAVSIAATGEFFFLKIIIVFEIFATSNPGNSNIQIEFLRTIQNLTN